MDEESPCSSKNLPGGSVTGTMGKRRASSNEPDPQARRTRKKFIPSTSPPPALPSSSNAVAVCSSSSGSNLACLSKSDDNLLDSYQITCRCPICMDLMQEPMIAFCGHSYCRACILTLLQNGTAKCPQCSVVLSQDKMCPNFTLNDVITKCRRDLELKAELSGQSEGGPSSSSNVITMLAGDETCQNLNLSDLDRLLLVLNRRRETMASNDEQYQRNMLHEFLTELYNLKKVQLDQLSREMEMISEDIAAVAGGQQLDFICEQKPTPHYLGFNTQPLSSVEQLVHARKNRMYSHFEELTQLYFNSTKSTSEILLGTDATVPKHPGQEEDQYLKLNQFSKTLSSITQYSGIKQLATLSYEPELVSASAASIVCTIEFDKDNEFFAVAGVTKKIKLFDYVNVIGTSVSMHLPSLELNHDTKISSLGWNPYFKHQLVSGDYGGLVVLWDVASGARAKTFAEHERRVWSVDWSNGDPRLFASGSDDHKVKLWSTTQAGSVINLISKTNVCSVKFCPDGGSTYKLAVASADHCVYYYDLRYLSKPLAVFYGHQKTVSYVRFASPQEIVSASTDGTLKLWHAIQGQDSNCVRTFSGHVNTRNFVGLATEGNYIACGSENNSLFVYSKYLSKPVASFKFKNHDIHALFQGPSTNEALDFVSAVSWKKGSSVMVAANGRGMIKILELV